MCNYTGLDEGIALWLLSRKWIIEVRIWTAPGMSETVVAALTPLSPIQVHRLRLKEPYMLGVLIEPSLHHSQGGFVDHDLPCLTGLLFFKPNCQLFQIELANITHRQRQQVGDTQPQYSPRSSKCPRKSALFGPDELRFDGVFARFWRFRFPAFWLSHILQLPPIWDTITTFRSSYLEKSITYTTIVPQRHCGTPARLALVVCNEISANAAELSIHTAYTFITGVDGRLPLARAKLSTISFWIYLYWHPITNNGVSTRASRLRLCAVENCDVRLRFPIPH